METNGWPRRLLALWIACANSSFPVPLSPRMSMLLSLFALRPVDRFVEGLTRAAQVVKRIFCGKGRAMRRLRLHLDPLHRIRLRRRNMIARRQRLHAQRHTGHQHHLADPVSVVADLHASGIVTAKLGRHDICAARHFHGIAQLSFLHRLCEAGEDRAQLASDHVGILQA